MSNDEAVWKRDRIRDDILIPCITCRQEKIGVSLKCQSCMKEDVFNAILKYQNN